MVSTEKQKTKPAKNSLLNKFWSENLTFLFVLVYLYFNPEKTGGHGEDHGHKEHHDVSTWYYVNIAIGCVIFIFFIQFFYFNPSLTDNIILLLHIIQIVFATLIIFSLFKLRGYMKEFSRIGSDIVNNYESKLKHHGHHEGDKNSLLENKYNLAMQQLNSNVENEWKSGLVDLDNYIRLALLDKNYTGNTTLELLNDAKSKGHKHVVEAENIAYLRQRLKAKGSHFDFSKNDLDILVKKFDEFKKTLVNESSSHLAHGEH